MWCQGAAESWSTGTKHLRSKQRVSIHLHGEALFCVNIKGNNHTTATMLLLNSQTIKTLEGRFLLHLGSLNSHFEAKLFCLTPRFSSQVTWSHAARFCCPGIIILTWEADHFADSLLYEEENKKKVPERIFVANFVPLYIYTCQRRQGSFFVSRSSVTCACLCITDRHFLIPLFWYQNLFLSHSALSASGKKP